MSTPDEPAQSSPAPIVSAAPSQAPAPPAQAPTWPAGTDRPPVTEAIDISTEPLLGDSWEVTDGNPADEHLEAQFLVSPCGVFVTMLTTSAAERDSLPEDQRGLGSRIIGFDIDSGKQLWSHDLRSITGQGDPALYTNPSYTPSCQMVFMTVDMAPQPQSLFLVSLSIDLFTGANAMVSTDDRVYCQAAGDGWVGCYGETYEQGSWAVNINDLSSPGWQEASDADAYSAHGDIVVDGRIWTPEGYRDPVTGTVEFGPDTSIGGQPFTVWFTYVEAYTPGGYRSGVVARFAGGMYDADTQCDLMVWDTGQDTGMWREGQTVPCDGARTLMVSGGALLLTHQPDPQAVSTTSAYDLADGHLLWQYDGSLLPTPFDQAYSGADKLYGVSQACVFLVSNVGTNAMSENIVRISDGASIGVPQFSVNIFSETMAYEAAVGPTGQFNLIAYQINPADPGAAPDMVWSVPISDQTQQVWTFATNGTMYVVYGNGSMSVAPLLVT